MGDGRAEGSSPIDGGQAATSLTPDADGTGSGLEIKILYSIQYCTVKYTEAQPLVEDART